MPPAAARKNPLKLGTFYAVVSGAFAVRERRDESARQARVRAPRFASRHRPGRAV